MIRKLLRKLEFVELYILVDPTWSKQKQWEHEDQLPSIAQYQIKIKLPVLRPYFPDKYETETFQCLYRRPHGIDCAKCEFSNVCSFGNIWSPVQYGVFQQMICADCVRPFVGVWGSNPCKFCGSKKVKPQVEGNPHKHGFWVFELHILDHNVAVALGELLGVEFDNQLRFSCKGSWHNFRNDSSGFDVCHVSCLNDLIETRMVEGLRGQELFMSIFPEEGKVLTGNNRVIQYWKNSRLRPVSEYFLSRGKGIPVRRQ